MHDDEFPCPCDACDSFSLARNEYCVTCVHYGCKGKKAKCPAAQRSHNWCDYCNLNKETVKALPSADENRICGNCHPNGKLPDDEEWWDERESEPEGRCKRCGDDYGILATASCTECGFVPEENRA